VRDEISALCEASQTLTHSPQYDGMLEFAAASTALQKVTEIPMYRVDTLVRHAQALQKAVTAKERSARLNNQTASQYQLTTGDRICLEEHGAECLLPVMIDEQVPDHVIVVSAAMAETAQLGDSFGNVEIKKR